MDAALPKSDLRISRPELKLRGENLGGTDQLWMSGEMRFETLRTFWNTCDQD